MTGHNITILILLAIIALQGTINYRLRMIITKLEHENFMAKFDRRLYSIKNPFTEKDTTDPEMIKPPKTKVEKSDREKLDKFNVREFLEGDKNYKEYWEQN
jgi:hypothetical protein